MKCGITSARSSREQRIVPVMKPISFRDIGKMLEQLEPAAQAQIR